MNTAVRPSPAFLPGCRRSPYCCVCSWKPPPQTGWPCPMVCAPADSPRCLGKDRIRMCVKVHTGMWNRFLFQVFAAWNVAQFQSHAVCHVGMDSVLFVQLWNVGMGLGFRPTQLWNAGMGLDFRPKLFVQLQNAEMARQILHTGPVCPKSGQPLFTACLKCGFSIASLSYRSPATGTLPCQYDLKVIALTVWRKNPPPRFCPSYKQESGHQQFT